MNPIQIHPLQHWLHSRHIWLLVLLVFGGTTHGQQGLVIDYADESTASYADHLAAIKRADSKNLYNAVSSEEVYRALNAPMGFTLVVRGARSSFLPNPLAIPAELQYEDDEIEFVSSMGSNLALRNIASGQTLAYFYSKRDKKFVTVDAPDAPIDWHLGTETKPIAGYICTSAAGYFCSDTLQAYFTTAIPVSAGPFLFSGLPGLILELTYSRGKRRLLAQGVQVLDDTAIAKLPIQYIQSSYEEPPKHLSKPTDDPADFCSYLLSKTSDEELH